MGGDGQLSFRRGAIITNVTEEDSPWWHGNHGGAEDLLFPANYVEVIDNNEAETDKKAETISISLGGCVLELICIDKRSAFKLYFGREEFIFSCNDQAEFGLWLNGVKDGIEHITETQEQQKKEEVVQRRAKELSDLIVYCQAVRFKEDGLGTRIAEMSSFSENLIKQYLTKDRVGILTKYNQRQISRVYPSGFRVMSANYDPIAMWCVGVQMVALNYQTADKYQQINHALFQRNNRCGYVLKPQCMENHRYSPFNTSSFTGVTPITLSVSILAGRNCYGGRSGATGNPFVGIEIFGLPLDKQRVRTNISKGTTLSPIWKNELFLFDVTFPDLAFLRFEISDESFEKSKTIFAQATVPLFGIREGYRCVPLCNLYGEKNELSSLLVHIEIKNPLENESKSVFKMIEELRNQTATMDMSDHQKKQFEDTEKQLLKYLDERQNRRREASLPHGRNLNASHVK